MKLRTHLVVLFGLLLLPFLVPHGQCQSLDVKAVKGYLNVIFQDIVYPEEKVIYELKSGLPNRFVASLSLAGEEKNSHSIQIIYMVSYDLWDEEFTIKIVENGRSIEKNIKNIADVVNILNRFVFEEVLIPSNLLGEKIEVSAHVKFNPISEERVKKIQRWISRGRGRVKNISSSPTRTGNVQSAINSNFLLKNFLRKSIGNRSESAEWKSQVVTVQWYANQSE